jgi:hypothetical protein
MFPCLDVYIHTYIYNSDWTFFMEKHPINQTCCPGKLEELCQEFIDQTMSNFGHQMTGTQRLWGGLHLYKLEAV